MLFSTSEIKVALLGNVSAGKTTVLNALFRDKYGEVSMKRTTAGVNYFRIVTPGKEASGKDKKEGESKIDNENKMHGNAEEVKKPWCPDAGESRTAKSTLEEITEDNKKLRESNEVKEKWFDIELDEHIMEMRKDTNLVIVDVPGINEAGACSKYKEYVNAKWHTFDCVVAVMDGKQGVNTEDQVHLLKLIRANNEQIKEIPIVVLFNKVDDPKDQEQAGLVHEAKEEIYRMFLAVPPIPSKPSWEGTFNVEDSWWSCDVCMARNPSEILGVNKCATCETPRPGASFGFPRPGASSGFPRPGASPGFSFGGTAVPMSNNTPTPFGATSSSKPASGSSSAFPWPTKAPVFGGGASIPTFGDATLPGTPAKGFIFGVSSKVQSGGDIAVTPVAASHKVSPGTGPEKEIRFPEWPKYLAFLPVSAMHAFIYQSASKMSIEQFEHFFDKELIEKTGRYQIGQHKWNKLSAQERLTETFAIITDPDTHLEAFQDSNFGSFLVQLQDFVGGHDTQCMLIEKQIDYILSNLKNRTVTGGGNLSHHIESAFTKIQAFRGQTASQKTIKELLDAFKEANKRQWSELPKRIQQGPLSTMKYYAFLMSELISFYTLSQKLRWEDSDYVLKRMEGCIRNYITNLYQMYSYYDRSTSLHPRAPWHLTSLAWSQVWNSISLMSYSKHFCVTFGGEILKINSWSGEAQYEWQKCLQDWPFAQNGDFGPNRSCPNCGQTAEESQSKARLCTRCQLIFYKGGCPPSCPSCKSAIKNGKCSQAGNKSSSWCLSSYEPVQRSTTLKEWTLLKTDEDTKRLVPAKLDMYRKLVPFNIPSSPSDPTHFGHIIYKWCELMESIDKGKDVA